MQQPQTVDFALIVYYDIKYPSSLWRVTAVTSWYYDAVQNRLKAPRSAVDKLQYNEPPQKGHVVSAGGQALWSRRQKKN